LLSLIINDSGRKLASDIVDPERPGDFNQALMDVILCSLLPFIKHASLDPWFVLPQSHPVIDAPLNLSVMLLVKYDRPNQKKYSRIGVI
jgi:hypothetical protein